MARIAAMKWTKFIGVLLPKLILATATDKCNVTIADTNNEHFIVKYSAIWCEVTCIRPPTLEKAAAHLYHS